jgi:hypothetical protein
MQLNEIQDITDSLALMPDPALQQYAQMHKDDPYVMSLAMSESNRRKKLRAAQQGQAGQMPQPKVVDQAIAAMNAPPPQQMPPQQAAPQGAPQGQGQGQGQGIAQLPTPNLQGMADGGIAGYDDEEDVQGMARGGNAGSDPFAAALILEGITDPRQIAYLRSIHGQESGGGKNTKTSNRGAIGGMQILPDTFKSVADAGMDIKDPVDNARAGIRYAMQGYQAAQGNPTLAAAYYYGGPSGLEKAKKGIAVSDPKNPNNPNTLEYGKSIAKRMTDLLPIGSAQAAEATPASKKGLAALPAAQETDLSDPMSFSIPQGAREASAPPAKAAPVAGAPQKPWYDRYREALTSGEGQRQMLLGAGDIPYELLGAPADIGSNIAQSLGYKGGESYLGSKNLKRLGTQYLGREADSTDPTLQGMRTVGGIAGLGVNPTGTLSKVANAKNLKLAEEALATRKEAEAAKTGIDAIRLENPAASSKMIVNPEGVASTEGRINSVMQANADKAAAAEAATAAQKAEAAAKGTLTPEEYLKLNANATRAGDVARGNALAANIPPVGNDALRLAGSGEGEYGEPGMGAGSQANRDLLMHMEREQQNAAGAKDTKNIIAAAKETADPEVSKGWTNDDWLTFGLSALASNSPRFLQGIGEAGLATQKQRQARTQQESAQQLTKAQIGKLNADTEYLQDQKGQNALRMKALSLASADIDKWMTTAGLASTPEEQDAARKKITAYYMQQMGVTPATMGGTGIAGFKFLGAES